MQYIIRMHKELFDNLKGIDGVVSPHEEPKSKTVDIAVSDLDTFLESNSLYIDHEFFRPSLIKMGIWTVGVLVSPCLRDEKSETRLEEMMMELFKQQRSYKCQTIINIQEKQLLLTNND